MVLPTNYSINACLDHTNLYKSFVKTYRARSKANGTALPPTRIFPTSSNVSTNKVQDDDEKKQRFASSAQYFQKAREIQDNIATYKQLLYDHRRKYLGQMNDTNSMSAEDCVYVDKIIANNLQTVEKLIVGLEEQVPVSILQKYRKAAVSEVRPGDDHSNNNDKDELKKQDGGDTVKSVDLQCCMAITIAILRADLQHLSTTFAGLRERKAHKQTVKAKLTRLHRPTGVEKHSTTLLRQRHIEKLEKEKLLDDPVTRNCRKKVQFEDWRDDEENYSTCAKTANGSAAGVTNTDGGARLDAAGTTASPSGGTANGTRWGNGSDSELDMDTNSDNIPLKHSLNNNNNNIGLNSITDYQSDDNILSGEFPERKIRDKGDVVRGAVAADYSPDIEEELTAVTGMSADECQMLEQENMQLYNQLQSTHEEVQLITRQVAELGRLQDVLLESVEEQAVVADSVQHLVMTATDNVQEGNEQIREAMRKDASFRVWILFFLIVMSFTILFLDWYNN